MSSTLRGIITLLVLAGLAGCGGLPRFGDVVKDRQVEYKSARSMPSLEIPPDLAPPGQGESIDVPEAAPGSTTLSSYRGGPQAAASATPVALGETNKVRVVRDANRQWLVVQADADQVFPKVRDFWVKNGFVLKIDDPKIGILETDWAENRADIPQDPIRRLIGKVLDVAYSAATRDKFRVRLERGEAPGTTEVYLSHRGMEEVSQGENFVWQPRPADPDLEAEMLKRLMVALGVEEKQAGTLLAAGQPQAPRASVEQGPQGSRVLTLNEDFSRAWRRTGLALDKVGFTVEDRDRSRGVYYVRYIPPDEEEPKKGFLSRLAFWHGSDKPKREDYLVSLTGEGESTRVAVLDKEGHAETSKTGQRIIDLLYAELK